MTTQKNPDITPIDVITQYMDLLQRQQLESIVALYAPDAEIVPDQAPSLTGLAAIRAFYEETFRTIRLAGELIITSSAISGDVATVRSEEPATVTILATGDEVRSYFRELFVLQRVEDRWLIQTYMFSQNPAQAAQA